MSRNVAGIPFVSPTRYVGPEANLVPILKANREPLGKDNSYPLGQLWLIDKNPTTGVTGELWYLSDYNANVAIWIQLIVGTVTPTLNTLTGSTPTIVFPDGAQNIDLFSEVVANSGVPFFANDTAANTITYQVQVGTAIASAPGDKNDSGLLSMDSNIFTTDTDGFTSTTTLLTTQGFTNLGINYNAGSGVFTIHSANGTALSATNPATITLPSKTTPGQLLTVKVTANQSFIDDNQTSEIIDNLFGLDTGIAYDQDLPFFIYAVVNDAENAIQFMISRNLFATTSPIAADIGAPDDAVADKQNDFWSIDNIDETLFESNPCLVVGSFRMRFSALDDWTVQTLDLQDGMGQLQENRNFIVDTGAFGSVAGNYLRDNGGTAPSFTNLEMRFQQSRNQIQVWFDMEGDGGIQGAGVPNTQIILPYTTIGLTIGNAIHGIGFVSSGVFTGPVTLGITSGEQILEMRRTPGSAFIQNQGFNQGPREIQGQVIYVIGDNAP